MHGLTHYARINDYQVDVCKQYILLISILIHTEYKIYVPLLEGLYVQVWGFYDIESSRAKGKDNFVECTGGKITVAVLLG